MGATSDADQGLERPQPPEPHDPTAHQPEALPPASGKHDEGTTKGHDRGSRGNDDDNDDHDDHDDDDDDDHDDHDDHDHDDDHGGGGGGASGGGSDEGLLARGNPPRLLRGGLTLALGALLALSVMSYERQLRWGVPIGLVGVLVATFGALDLAGSFDDRREPSARVKLGALAGPLALLGVSLGWVFAVLTLSTQGRLAPLTSALLMPAGAIAAAASLFRVGVELGPWATDEAGQPRPLLRRHGFWVVAAASLLYWPAAGAHSLTDPWETHYGEVAREMIARNDWVSTWWAQDGWFFSKPVLNFWIQALAMSALGVKAQPGEMLALVNGAAPRPEWAVRAPVVLMSIAALYLLYKGVARVFGRRAGLLGALALMAMPDWAFLSHQTMTDMPFVAALSAAMGLVLMGIHTDPDEQARVYEVEVGGARLRLSAYHLVFGLVVASALPQVLYLISRNLDLLLRPDEHVWGFRWHLDVFWAGSKGNCGLPGNEPCVEHRPFNAVMQPGIQGLLWAGVLGALLYVNWGERRVQRLCYVAAALCAAISTLGKGPAGLLLPALCAALYVGVTGRWRELTRFEALSALLILLAVAMPWYTAMHLRHGPAFIDRLIFHDMWKRALTHVHDTNEGDDVSFRFYIWQLGYAVFPWTGLVPLSLVWWARKPDDADEGKGDASVFLAMWFVLAFALFTWMLTKFHHYIFPAIPPAAMLTGVLLDRLLGPGAPGRAPRLALMGFSGALLGYGLMRMVPGSLDGFRGAEGALRPASPAVAAAAVALALGLGVWAALGDEAEQADRAAQAGGADEPRPGSAALSAALLGGVGLVLLAGRDLSSRPPADVVGEARLLHLFTYNYRRIWPDSLDFTAVMTGVTAAAGLLSLLLASRRFRAAAAAGLLGLSLAFGAFCLDVYFVKTAPHWGQRETVEAYYRLRQGPQEPLVGYQMNWKGENFYTGNRLPAFVSSGERFKTWVKEQRDRGVATMFFTTEHTRVPNLRTELGPVASLEVLTDRSVNNKFTLVRVRF